MTESHEARMAAIPHVLVIPKWWPNERDPQLGDFIRKQVQSLARFTEVTVLLIEASAADEHSVRMTRSDGLMVVRSSYPASGSRVKAWRKLVNLVRYRHAAYAGWRTVHSERGMPAITHVHILVRPALIAWWLKRRFGIPYILSEQSSEYLDGTYQRKGSLFHALNTMLFKEATAVTAVSNWLGDGLVKLGLCSHYEVVPNVIPGLDRPLPQRGAADHFLVVADLVDRTKNVSGVIRSVALLHQRRVLVRLDIIGDGPDLAQLRELAVELGVKDRIVFLGRLPNSGVLDHMANVGAVIINSNVETFSVVTGEALAQGKPVIATRCGGPEAFVRPDNGLLIPVGDTAALADAMAQFVRDHERYDPQRIREGLSSTFGPDAVGKAFLRIHQRSLGAGR
ncbi:MAG TPA: glycosyltransferase [Flavobacteriales bacterium]|nr:glycosyltransferase [Flavobacteriales bacterium]